ncbi:MAG: nucleoside hydrolase [Bacteroidota bacterium]
MNVWIDTDLAIGTQTPDGSFADVDDAYAILQMMLSPDVQIAGISTVFGNTDVDTATRLSQELCATFAPQTPVFRGADSPLNLQQLSETDATHGLRDALRKQALSILAIGPATNLAAVLLVEPELAYQIDTVILVAGRRNVSHAFKVGPKQEAPFRDLNFDLDPVAFQILLQFDLEIVLVPFEVSHKVWVGEQELTQLAEAGPAGKWLADRSYDWLAQWKTFGSTGFNPFDLLASAWMLRPHRFQTVEQLVDIQIGPDDRQPSGNPFAFKPYLLVSPTLTSSRKVRYVHTPPGDFMVSILEDFSRT